MTYIKKHKFLTLILLSILSNVILPFNSIEAIEPPIKIIETSAVSQFPAGILFKVKATSNSEIESVAVRLKIGLVKTGIYEYLAFDTADIVEAELLWKTNTLAGYIPPETIIHYTFEIQDAEQTSGPPRMASKTAWLASTTR